MRRWSLPGLLLLTLAACADQSPLAPPVPEVGETGAFGLIHQEPLVVMSRNLYLGADIDGLLDPGADLETVIARALAEIVRTDFTSRAPALAREIQESRPHALGLQEVTSYTVHLADGTVVPFPQLNMPLDFLEVLRAELAALGESYEVAVRLTNLAVSLPLGELAPGVPLFIRYADGEAILVRSDVAVTAAAGHHFANQQTISVGGLEFPNLRGWVWADLVVAGAPFRLVSTHLEVQQFRDVQERQATELVAALAGIEQPVVLVGDFNSAANHDAPPASRTATYRMLRNAGFADLWLRQAHSVGGYTCCQASDLSNTTSELDQRLDIVFARFGRAGFGGRSEVHVVGAAASDIFTHALGYTLWPSDHAGIVASMWAAPGRLAR